MATVAISDQTIKMYASIFADVFKNKGVMSANTTSIIGKPSETGSSPLDDYKLRLKQESLIKKNNKLLDEFSDLQDVVNDKTKDSIKAKEDLSKIEKQLETDSVLLGKSYVEAARSLKDGSITKKEFKEFASNEDYDKLNRSFAQKMDVAGDTMAITLGRTAEEVHTKSSRLIDKSLNILNRKALMTASFIQFASDFRASLKYGSDMTRNVFGKQWDALTLGISTTELNELEAQNKRLVNAFGGAKKFEDAINTGSGTLFKVYGDLGETTKGTIQALQSLSMAGIKPSMKMMVNQRGELSELNKTMFHIRSLTGQTFAEQNAAMNEYIQSDVAKSKLAALGNSKERFNLIQRDQANKLMLTSLGLTADQANRVSESFNAIAGMDPKDRLKESYKAQAVAAAMGIENADAIGQVMRAGGIDKVPKEVAANYTAAMTQIAKKQAEATSGQITSTGLFNSALLNVSGTLGEQAKVARDGILADKKAADLALARSKMNMAELSGSHLIGAISEGLKVFDIVSTGLAGNALLTGILGIATLILSNMKTVGKFTGKSNNGKGYDNLKKTNTKVDKSKPSQSPYNKGKRAVGTAVTNTSTVLGKTAKGAVSMVSGGIKGLGSTVGKGLSSAASMGGSALKMGGKLLGKVAGPIAIAMSIGDAIDGWKNSSANFDTKKLTAGMKAASALGSVVSGLSFGIVDSYKVANLVYGDYEKLKTVKPLDKKVAMPTDIRPETKKPTENETNIQTEFVKLQIENNMLLTTLNSLISDNFDKVHQSNNKKLSVSNNIKDILDNNEPKTLMGFNDDGFVFT